MDSANQQWAARGLKCHVASTGFQALHYYGSRRQGSMPAKGNFRCRCKPAQAIFVIDLDQECCLSQVVLCGDVLHHRLIWERLHQNHGRRISLETARGEGIEFENSCTQTITFYFLRSNDKENGALGEAVRHGREARRVFSREENIIS